MSDAQWRVTVLLLVVMGLDIGLNPTARQTVTDVASGKATIRDIIGKMNAAAAGYAVSALILIALAAIAPKPATWIAVILLGLVIIRHPNPIMTATHAAIQSTRPGVQQ